MKLDEIIDTVLIRSGQIIVDNLDELNLTKKKFVTLIRNEIVKYSKYCPHTERINIQVDGCCGTYYEFTKDSQPYGIPRWISELVPISGANTTYELFTRKFFYSTYRNELRDPQTLIWRYDRPYLYITALGGYDTVAHYDHPMIETRDDKNELTDFELPTIESDKDEIFIDLLTAQFMIVLGRSRRAYKVEGIPMSTDDNELISDGQAMYELAYQRMLDNSAWHHSFGI